MLVMPIMPDSVLLDTILYDAGTDLKISFYYNRHWPYPIVVEVFRGNVILQHKFMPSFRAGCRPRLAVGRNERPYYTHLDADHCRKAWRS